MGRGEPRRKKRKKKGEMHARRAMALSIEHRDFMLVRTSYELYKCTTGWVLISIREQSEYAYIALKRHRARAWKYQFGKVWVNRARAHAVTAMRQRSWLRPSLYRLAPKYTIAYTYVRGKCASGIANVPPRIGRPRRGIRFSRPSTSTASRRGSLCQGDSLQKMTRVTYRDNFVRKSYHCHCCGIHKIYFFEYTKLNLFSILFFIFHYAESVQLYNGAEKEIININNTNYSELFKQEEWGNDIGLF